VLFRNAHLCFTCTQMNFAGSWGRVH
jgi:hypothetical protein